LDGLGEYRQPKCLRCHSLHVAVDELNKRLTFAALFLLNLPIRIVRKDWNCHACRNR
jgi:hypothetical protein